MRLIERTDARFRGAANAAVLGFIERANPSCHSDTGEVLIRLGRAMGVGVYCPAWGALAYVALHTEAGTIFGIGWGMRQVAFRVGEGAVAELGAGWEGMSLFDPAVTREAEAARMRALAVRGLALARGLDDGV